jgi:hypothetical protein
MIAARISTVTLLAATMRIFFMIDPPRTDPPERDEIVRALET